MRMMTSDEANDKMISVSEIFKTVIIPVFI